MIDEPTLAADATGPPGGGWRRGLFAQQTLLYGLAALILLILAFGASYLTTKERANADRAAHALARDAADTYEAQVLRSLREIDHALRLVAYMAGRTTATEALAQLESRELLPPSLIFRVDILSSRGDLLASNHAAASTAGSHVGELLEQALRNGEMVVGAPVLAGEEWRLRFARRIEASGADGAGVVTLSLPANFFVSGYDQRSLGESGLLALIGHDGDLLVWRSNESMSTGGRISGYSTLLGSEETLLHRGPDGLLRYTFAREIFGYPLTILVGLAQHEQLAPAAAVARSYWIQTAIVSAGLVMVFGLLGWYGQRLHRAQQSAMEERTRHARQVEYLAFHDSLTALPNRALFSRLLAQGIRQSRRYQHHLALLFLDLDRFKMVNDLLGHDAGDELLREVARRLRAAVRDSDTVARLGGDEFVVLLPEIDDTDQITAVAEKMLMQVAQPFTLAGQEFRITVSIGATIYPNDGENEEALLKNADRAMYHAKELGKNNFQYFSSELRNDSQERLGFESSLHGAPPTPRA